MAPSGHPVRININMVGMENKVLSFLNFPRCRPRWPRNRAGRATGKINQSHHPDRNRRRREQTKRAGKSQVCSKRTRPPAGDLRRRRLPPQARSWHRGLPPGLRGHPGGPPRPSLGVSGVSGALPEAPGTHHEPNQKTYEPKNSGPEDSHSPRARASVTSAGSSTTGGS